MAAAPPPPPPPRVVVDTGEPGEPGEPSNRWPWVALGLGLLIIAVAVAFFLFSRQRAVNVTVEGTPTVNPVARAGTASPGPPPTVVPPTLPASATLAPTATAAPSPTQPSPSPTQPSPTQPSPTQPPPPTEPPAPPTAVPAPTSPPVVQPTLPPQATQPPPPPAQPAATVPPTSPPAAATAAATPSPAAPAGPTPFAGQVAGPAGFGNTRADLDAALGPPTGETPDHLVAYHKGNFDYHVGFMPDANGRAALLVGLGQPQPLTLEQATAEAHRLLPKDAQPSNPPQEASPQYVVERYTSQLLAQALNKGQSAQFLAVYVRDPAQAARITRFIIGLGTDPNALVNQGR